MAKFIPVFGSLKRNLLKKYFERWVAEIIGRVFWPPCSVAVLVHGEHDDILVLESEGSYELPGGLIDAGEGLKEAAKREVKEETGYDVEVDRLLDVRVDDAKHPGIHFYFEAEAVDGDAEGSWEGRPEFVAKEEMKDLNWKLHHSHVHEYLFPDES